MHMYCMPFVETGFGGNDQEICTVRYKNKKRLYDSSLLWDKLI